MSDESDEEEDGPRGHLVAVFGPFASKALVVVSAKVAHQMVDVGEIDAQPAFLINAVADELDRMPEEIADSAFAALARQLALEISNPFNSATSKAACSKELRETMGALRAWAADGGEEEDDADRRARERAERIARQSAAGAPSPS